MFHHKLALTAVVGAMATTIWVSRPAAQPGQIADPAYGLGIPEEQAVAFLTKKKACSAWAALVLTTDAGPRLVPRIVCIFKGKYAEGTVDEAKGCMIGWYNLRRSDYDLPPRGNALIAGKCTPSAASILLDGFLQTGLNWGGKLIYALGFPQDNSLVPWAIRVGGNKDVSSAISKAACASEHEHIRKRFGCGS